MDVGEWEVQIRHIWGGVTLEEELKYVNCFS